LAFDLKQAMADNADAVEAVLNELLEPGDGPEHRVMDAMRYSSLGGGKRIRPFLVTQSAALFGVDKRAALRAAAAVEMVHCYSLIHDDLPAMDDDDLRRGRATCHIEYDEATAILAGDALLTKAFEVLADPDTHQDARVRADLVLALSRAAGHAGMVGGQMLDLVAESHTLDMPEVTRLQRMKTGELIAVSCEAGAILGKASEHAHLQLHAYAHDIGLAFQIADDLLDVEGDEAAVGKKTGKDEAAGKATFVSLLGVERAREQAEMLSRQAQEHLESFDTTAEPLRALAHFIVNRRS
jgi:farnesyl diphosphate synthase